jgi:hypothetical protein
MFLPLIWAWPAPDTTSARPPQIRMSAAALPLRMVIQHRKASQAAESGLADAQHAWDWLNERR